VHQIIVRVQGGDEASLADVIAALEMAKGRLSAGMSNGTSRIGDVGFDFEAREVDKDHALPHLLSRRHGDEFRVATVEETRKGNRT